MSYGFSESIKIKNNKNNKKAWEQYHASKQIKHYVHINGRDVEIPTPNSVSISKPVYEAINPLHIKK